MDQGPRTFRDQFLSVYQSMAADVARQTAKTSDDQAGALESLTLKSDEVAAAEVAAARFAAARREGVGLEADLDETATLEEMSIPQNAKACAALALKLMWAKAT